MFPGLVADGDPQVTGLGDFPHRPPPRRQTGQRDADGFVAERLQPGQAQRLDRCGPVHVDGGVVVEQPTQDAGHELSEGVAQESGFVEEVPAVAVAAVGDQGIVWFVEGPPQHRDGGFGQGGGGGGVSGDSGQGGPDDHLVGGAERHPAFPDTLRADQATDQGEPAPEHHRGPALRLHRRQGGPALAEGSEIQRVDPRGQSVPDHERLHPEGVTQRFVLVLGVAEDQHPVAEIGHPEQERLAGRRFAAAGFAETHHVRVGHRHVGGQHPAERVGVETATRKHVDAHLRAGRRQPGGGDERPEHRRLVGGHPPRRHLRRRRRPAPPRPVDACAGRRVEQPRLFHRRRQRRGGGKLVAEVGQQVDDITRLGSAAGPHATPSRVRHTPSGMVDAANPRSCAKSSRNGAKPAIRIAASSRRPYSVIGSLRGTVTVHTA